MGAQVSNLAHTSKNLEDELSRTNMEVDQQYDDIFKKALKLAYKISQMEYKELDLG